MSTDVPIREGQTVTGPMFSEPMRVETVRSNGPGIWVAGLVGQRSERFRRDWAPLLYGEDDPAGAQAARKSPRARRA